MTDIKIQLEQAEEVFLLLEKLNKYFHQPLNYNSQEKIEEFASSIYPEIRTAYYNTVWDWLPEETQEKLENR